MEAVRRPTVLIISTSYPVIGDGSEAAGAFVADFATALSASVRVRVVGPGRAESRDLGSEIHVWRFAAGSRPLSLLSPLKPWHWPAIVGALSSLRRQVLAAAADGEVMHILALWVLPSGWAARLAARAAGVRYSVWALGSDIWSLGRMPLIRTFLASIGRDAHAAYADGIQLGLDAEKIVRRPFHFMPSCRALSGLRVRPVAMTPPYRLLYLGRWHPNKGIDLLFDALDMLGDGDWNRISEVHIAGGGPLATMVEARAMDLLNAGRPVRISGFLGRTEAEKALAVADRLLLPSRIESIPVVFSDALAYGVPVVAMPTGDLPHLIADGGGWLAREIGAEAFVEALRVSLGPTDDSRRVPQSLRDRFQVKAVADAFAASLQGVP